MAVMSVGASANVFVARSTSAVSVSDSCSIQSRLVSISGPYHADGPWISGGGIRIGFVIQVLRRKIYRRASSLLTRGQSVLRTNPFCSLLGLILPINGRSPLPIVQ